MRYMWMLLDKNIHAYTREVHIHTYVCIVHISFLWTLGDSQVLHLLLLIRTHRKLEICVCIVYLLIAVLLLYFINNHKLFAAHRTTKSAKYFERIENPIFPNLRLRFAHFSAGIQRSNNIFAILTMTKRKKMNSNDDLAKMKKKKT